MKRIFVISCILALASAVILAQNRTESNARQIASEFLSEIKGESVPLESAPARRMAPGVPSLDTPYYIVSDKNNESFVIVSGDERMTTILGYSLDKGYDANNLPEGLRDLLSEYEKAYQYLKTNGVDGKTRRNVAPSAAISPLVQTEWGQDKPYNNLCPKVGNEHTLTGCLATATSQIMNYYQYPNRGTGSVSYKTETLGLDINCNLESYAFDWQNMKNHYGFYSDNQGKAVSELMYCLGVSVQMDYGIEESGTYPDRLISVLVDNFGYQKQSLSLDFKDEYDLDSWTMMIDAELHASRPIIYNSYDANYTFGHCYILDGKDSEGRYHINWGWDGHYNGYYSLNALEPYDGLNISTDHIMLRGIKPGKCKVTYLLDGVVYYSVYLAEGERIPQIAEPSKSGYKFSGWTGLPETMGANDIQVTGSFVPLANEDYDTANNILYIKDRLDSKVKRYHTCQLPLLLNNTEGVIGFQCDLVLPDGAFVESIEKGSRIKNDASFSMSFNKQTNGITRIVGYSGTNTPIVGNTGEIAIVSLNIGDSKSGLLNIEIQNQVISKSDYSSIQGGESTFKLNVDNNYRLAYYVDGELYKSFDYYEGNVIVPLDNLFKDGYIFSGWSSIPNIMPANDVKILGSFSRLYLLTYLLNDSLYHQDSLVNGTKIVPIDAPPAREGMSFSGWNNLPDRMYNSDIVVSGSFIVNTYSIFYYFMDEDHDEDEEDKNVVSYIKYGDPIVPPEGPTKTGYTFIGWDGLPDIMPAYDLEVFPKYAVNSYAINFYFGEELVYVDSVQYGNKVTLDNLPQKEGYTFCVEDDRSFPFIMPPYDVTIKGHFNLNFHQISYCADGNLFRTDTLPFGALIEPNLLEGGYTFIADSNTPAAMPDSDLVIYGTLIANTYRIVYKLNEEVYYVDSVKYGMPITLIEIPTKEGYYFGGWSDVPETMPAQDIVVSGYLYRNRYVITFLLDGEFYHERGYEYGDSISYLPPIPDKYGYTFIGWQNLPETMPARNVTVDAIFAANTYCIAYIIDGDTIRTDSCLFGNEILLIEDPTKEGYTFSGWVGIPDTGNMPGNDLEIIGYFVANSYELVYVIDGENYSYTVKYGDPIVPLDDPTKIGYTFSGWGEIPETMPAHDVEIVATFSINSYTITYYVDGELYRVDTVQYQTEVTLEDAPQKVDHTFIVDKGKDFSFLMPAQDIEIEGHFNLNFHKLTYYLDGIECMTNMLPYGAHIDSIVSEGYTVIYLSEVPQTMPDHDVDIYFTQVVNTYRITYELGEDVYYVDSVEYGSSVTPIDIPTKEGFDFVGWNNVPEIMPAEDVVAYGYFYPILYTLTFSVDGEYYYSDVYYFGDSITYLPTPEKYGYTFIGWQNLPETMPARSVSVDAIFAVNTYCIKYVVDGEIYQTDSCSFGEEITAIQYPTKEGHTFSGWSEIPEKMPAHDVEITGSFSVNTYYLAYMVDSVCFDGFCVLYGETSIPVPADEPFKEGHTFNGWNGIPVTMPAHNVEVNGSFSVNTYTLTYMLDGEVYKTEQILYGDTIVPLEDPNKEGYTFSGWSEIPETMSAYDVEITGSFSVNKYTLTYMLDGEVYKTEQISYGETIVPAKAPTRSGYTFSGWSEIPETMPAHDVEISGSFKINVWNLIYRIDGEVYQSFEVSYGDTIVPLTDPAKEGYTFSGWSEIPETMPNHVVYVDGSFTINVYRVEISVNEGGHVEVSDTLPTYGSSIKISIIPDEGFEIASVVINNQDVTANVGAEGYHISDITSDINIVVTFSAIVGLDMMSVDSARNMTFDLSGRKVQNRMNGRVYIQNGKKMIMK